MTRPGNKTLAVRSTEAGSSAPFFPVQVMSSQSVTNEAHSPPDVSTGAVSQRSELRSLTGVACLGTGSYVPQEVVSNEDLARLGYDSDWIIQRTGIQTRRRAPEGAATSDLAYHAARRCLTSAKCDGSEVDLVLLATTTPDQPLPSTACLLQRRLGLRAGAMDLNAACAGFMYALITGAQFVKSGACRQVLAIGADTNTRIVNPADPKTYPLFGDGAGAVLLGAGGESEGLLAYTLGSEGEGADLLAVPAGGSRSPLTPERLRAGQQYIHMDGRPVFKWAVRLLADTVSDVLSHAQLTMDDIRLVILHQANLRIMEAAAEAADIEPGKLLVNLDRYGNTSAGSIPLGLDEAHRRGQIERGDKVILCGFGAGLAWGTAIIQW
jgi:3-oxoacyl-[acyl-carrier-protein] synthase-3